jgi:hypothetical protein
LKFLKNSLDDFFGKESTKFIRWSRHQLVGMDNFIFRKKSNLKCTGYHKLEKESTKFIRWSRHQLIVVNDIDYPQPVFVSEHF